MGLVDRFETGQKVLTAAPAGAAAPTGSTTALASPGTSRTELMRVFYVVLYPYRADSPLTAGCVAVALRPLRASELRCGDGKVVQCANLLTPNLRGNKPVTRMVYI